MAILFLIVFIDLLGFGIIIPQLPFYGVHFGASPAAVALLMSCYSFAQFFMSPVLGRLSDRIGRRPVLMVSMACSCLAYVWLGFASALWMLFCARLLAGAGAGNLAAAQAYITDVTSPEARRRGRRQQSHSGGSPAAGLPRRRSLGARVHPGDRAPEREPDPNRCAGATCQPLGSREEQHGPADAAASHFALLRDHRGLLR